MSRNVHALMQEKGSQDVNQLEMSKNKVEKVMHEFKKGKLHSGNKHGAVVKDKTQAVAIALSEGRKAARG